MELKLILKNSSHIVYSRVFKFILGILRSKLNAILLGPEGVGIVQQVIYLNELLSNASRLNMNEGVTKIIVENRTSRNYKTLLPNTIATYSLILIALVIVVLIMGIAFSQKITIYIFGDIKYYKFYVFCLFAFPIISVNSIAYSLLRSYKEIKSIARANIFSSLISFIVFVPLLLLFNITGVIVSLILSYIVILFLTLYFTKSKVLLAEEISISDLFGGRFQKQLLKPLGTFAVFGLTSGIAQMIFEFLSRALIIKNLGIREIGIYSPIIAWTGIITGVLLPSLNTYLYPRLCEIKNKIEISAIVNDVLRIINFAVIPFLFLGIPFRHFLITLFYSDEFFEASKYLPFHFFGTVLYFYWFTLALVLTPTGRIRLHGILVIFMAFIGYAVVYILLPYLGLYAWMLKFIIPPLIFLLIYLYILRSKYQFRISKSNISLIRYIFLGYLIIVLSENLIDQSFIPTLTKGIGILLTIGAIMFLKNNEVTHIKKKAKKLFQHGK